MTTKSEFKERQGSTIRVINKQLEWQTALNKTLNILITRKPVNP